MTNPYQSPSSDIKVEEKIKEGRLGWKIFFFIMLALELLTVFLYLGEFQEGTFELYNIPSLIIYPFIVLGLFGYAFHKRFFKQGFWKILLPNAFVADVYTIWRDFETDPELYSEPYIFGTMMVILLPILFLQYLVLYRYGFSQLSPWDDESVRESGSNS